MALSLAVILTGQITGYTMPVIKAEENNVMHAYEANDWKYGLGNSLGFNESTYKTIDKAATNDNWRDGSVTANGEIGFIESCDPKEDVFIFNNTKIVTDNNNIYETPDISNILDEQPR